MQLGARNMYFKWLGGVFFIIFISKVNATGLHDTRSGELDYFDRKLNKLYQKLLNQLDESKQQKLRKAQRQWIIFRDLDCEWAFSAEPLDCRMERTENRLKELQESMFFDTKGDYSSFELKGD